MNVDESYLIGIEGFIYIYPYNYDMVGMNCAHTIFQIEVPIWFLLATQDLQFTITLGSLIFMQD